MGEHRTRSVFTIGRIVSWLIVALMAASSIYSAAIGIINWGRIGV
ncbi:MAG: hypothetical protein ACYC2G_00445 [Gemmatimonadaceae bacterium]